jgi:hypothetical protein
VGGIISHGFVERTGVGDAGLRLSPDSGRLRHFILYESRSRAPDPVSICKCVGIVKGMDLTTIRLGCSE